MFTSSTKLFQGIAPASGAAAYQISRSLRFNSADSASLSRTPGSASNQQIWTWSGWVKRSKLGTAQVLFSAASSSPNNQTNFGFNSSDQLTFSNYNGSTNNADLVTTPVYRDVSSWYHLLIAIDTTQATSTNRIKIYVNGTQITAFGTSTYFAQNDNSYVNSTKAHSIGCVAAFGTSLSDVYMTEINFIDGQALTPSSFGQTDSTTGVWSPIAYTGTYGTNGFYLNFSDNSGTTATTLGKDSSGNGNNWTPNNFSVTAGVGNDSLVDSPTNYGTDTGAGGEVRGNYCTYNPLQVMASNPSFANGNLDVTANAGSWQGAAGSLAVTSGKWYWENTIAAVAASTGDVFVGIARADTVFTTANPQNISGTIVYLRSDGHKRIDGTDTTYGATYAANDVIGVALDMDASTVTFYKNNVSQGSISFSSSSLAGKAVLPFNIVITSPTQVVANFGQRPFAYTAPSGFKALCTQNLTTPTIGASSTTLASNYFNVSLWTGPSSGNTTVSSIGFSPDFVWTKPRSNAVGHTLFDTIRGATKYLQSNTTGAEGTAATSLISFNSDGYTVGQDTSTGFNGYTYVGWSWKAGGTASTNTSGTITSNVSVSTTAGFSVTQWTSTGSNGTVGHGLGAVPAFIICRRTNTTENWIVYHKNMGGSNGFLLLNSTAAFSTASAPWNSVDPTSSVYSINNTGMGAGTSNPMISYVFAEVSGYSKFGSYAGNGSTDGPFVYCGFRPRYIMVKGYAAAGAYWIVIDTARDPYNLSIYKLGPNVADAENSVNLGNSSQNTVDILSNGFKLRSTTGDTNNGSQSYIFAAFAESPFNYSRAR